MWIRIAHDPIITLTSKPLLLLYVRFHNSLGCVVNALSENRKIVVYPGCTCWLYDYRHTGTSGTYRRHVLIIACWVLFQQGTTKLFQIWRGIFSVKICNVLLSRFSFFNRQRKTNEKVLILNSKIPIVYLTTFVIAFYRKLI